MYHSIKSFLDYTFAIIGLIVFFPFSLIYALLIILLYRSNPIYLQKRSIDGKKYITLYKLKTIKDDALVVNVNNTTFYKVVTEDSFYLLGRFMRMTGLDEVPQLINVLKGEMSIVGPRPLMKEDLELIERENPSILSKRKQIKSKPGISGFWQIYRNCKMDFNELIEMDVFYDKHSSLRLDFHLVVKTGLNIMTVSHLDTLQSLTVSYEQNIQKIKEKYLLKKSI